MRIAIDARKLRDFGIGTYIRNILIELSRLDQTTEYVVLCRPDDQQSGEVLGRNFRMVPETAPTYSLAEQCGFRSRSPASACKWCMSRTMCCRLPSAAGRW